RRSSDLTTPLTKKSSIRLVKWSTTPHLQALWLKVSHTILVGVQICTPKNLITTKSKRPFRLPRGHENLLKRLGLILSQLPLATYTVSIRCQRYWISSC